MTERLTPNENEAGGFLSNVLEFCLNNRVVVMLCLLGILLAFMVYGIYKVGERKVYNRKVQLL